MKAYLTGIIPRMWETSRRKSRRSVRWHNKSATEVWLLDRCRNGKETIGRGIDRLGSGVGQYGSIHDEVGGINRLRMYFGTVQSNRKWWSAHSKFFKKRSSYLISGKQLQGKLSSLPPDHDLSGSCEKYIKKIQNSMEVHGKFEGMQFGPRRGEIASPPEWQLPERDRLTSF